jgi:FAD/FMN-containing dehydrogenase
LGDSSQHFQSWGRYPRSKHAGKKHIFWQDEVPDLTSFDKPVLAVGYGRSYGDSCQNDDGILLDTTGMRRFLAFDEEAGIIRCEAGVMLAEILDVIVPRGWFLPVSPGTKYVSVAGALANDVHGKNHHQSGTFGCHVTQFELLRSNGERLICSPTKNKEMFAATIGGLGLTGLILWVEFRLRAVAGPFIVEDQIQFSSVDEFFDIAAESDDDYEYSGSWLDCLSSKGRGVYIRGNHAELKTFPGERITAKPILNVPFDFPSFTLNTLSIKAFNFVIYHKQLGKRKRDIVRYDPFFYPLDVISDWNRIYGSRGFLQYQCVVRYDDGHHAIKEILQHIAHSGEASFFAVLKTFGTVRSPGMLSFPRPGVTLALDFPMRGESTLKLLNTLDHIVQQNCGSVYPAKDARMSGESFQIYYPQWRQFEQYVDPKFSSSFWRRVTRSREDAE